MNIRALRLFVEIMDSLTLSRASGRLNISQPAASRLIKLLEDDLGTALFSRERKRLHPTPAAEALMPEAVQILQSIDNLPAALARGPGAGVAPLRILCLPRIVDGLVLPVLARLHRDDPAGRFNVDVCPRREFGRRLLNGGYDVGVSSLPIPAEGLETHHLARVELQVMVAPHSTLAARKRIGIADLRNQRYIALNRHSAIRTAVDAALSRSSADLEVAHEVSTSDVAYWFVRNGMGFTFADPASVAAEARGKVAVVPCDLDVGFEIAFFLPRAEKAHASLQRFLAYLAEQSRSMYAVTAHPPDPGTNGAGPRHAAGEAQA